MTTSSRTWLEVADAMSKDVATISSDKTVVSAAKVMAEVNISCIIVKDNGTLTGIVTETDLLKRGVAEGKNLRSTKVSEIMSFPVESISHNISVLEASRIMYTKGIKRMPVLDGQRLVGIVTQTDLIRILTLYGMWRDVSMIMSRDICAIQRKATVTETAKIMADRNVSSIIVMDGDEAVGVFSEKDLFKRVIAQKKRPDHICVGKVMSSPVVSITPDCSVFSASRIMERKHIRMLVVMEGKQLCGILSQTDIFAAVKQKLQEEEEKNHRLLELSKSNIYTLLSDGKITYVNPSFMDLLGISDPSELIGQDFLPDRFWFNKEDRESFLRELRNEVVQTKELNLKDSKGKRVYVTFFANFSKNAHGKIDGIHGVLQDITAKKELAALREAENALQVSEQRLKTSNEQLLSKISEQKRTEEELKQTNACLEASIKRANLMAQEAHLADKAKGQFLANMSHEIRTPMNAIIGFSDLLADGELSDEKKQAVEIISESGYNLLKIIDDILDFSKIEAGQLDTEIIDCSLGELLNSVESLMRPKATEKGLEFEIVESDTLPAQICSDPTRLRQCLINLINNAIKFTEKGCIHVNVSLEESEGKQFIRFNVKDTGIGISHDKQKSIFDSFTQAEGHTSRKYGGTGLGLAITKKLAELLGGQLSLTSKKGKGSEFSLMIPAGVDVTKGPFLDRTNIAEHTDGDKEKREQPKLTSHIIPTPAVADKGN
ncbi:MAG: CBS domain-containing protein [Planctomycetota bacterium]